MKYRVDDKVQFEIIDDLLNLDITNSKNNFHKEKECYTIKELITSLKIEDIDLQLHNKMIIVTGNINLNTIFSVNSTYLSINSFEINEGKLTFFYNCSNFSSIGGIELIVFQLLIDYK
jgi:hypothetical protein